MPRTLIPFFILLFIPTFLVAQSNQYIEVQDSISSIFKTKNYNLAKDYLNSLEPKTQSVSSLITLSLVKTKLKTKNIDSIPELLTTVIDTKTKDSLAYYLTGLKYEYLAHYYFKTNEIDSSINYINISNSFYKKSNNISKIVYNHIIIGIIYRKQNEYINSLNQYYKAIDFYNHYDLDYGDYVTAQIDVAIIYNALDKYQKSNDILTNLLLDTSKLTTIKTANIYNNLATNYVNLNKDTLAYNYLLKAEALYNKLENYPRLSLVYNNLASFRIDLYKDTVMGLSYFQKSLEIKELLQDTRGIAETSLNLCKVYYSKKDLNKSLLFGEKSIQLSKEINNKELLRDGHSTLSMVYYDLKEYKKAYESQLVYQNYADEIWNRNKENQLLNLDKNLELKTIQNQLSLVEKENELTELKVNNNRKKTTLIIIYSVIILSFLLIYIFILKLKEKSKNKLYYKNLDLISISSLVQGQEDERNRIAKDLHDGVGNSLTLLMISLQKANNPELLKLAQTISQDVRSISYNLMPSGLTQFGLNKSVQDLCESWSNEKVIVDLNFNIANSYFTDKTSILTIYRIIQEIINNAITKGNATYISILFKENENNIYLVTEDNGLGFNVEQNSKGQGLNNIENRVKYLSGIMNLNSTSSGTTYTITFPKKLSTI